MQVQANIEPAREMQAFLCISPARPMFWIPLHTVRLEATTSSVKRNMRSMHFIPRRRGSDCDPLDADLQMEVNARAAANSSLVAYDVT